MNFIQQAGLTTETIKEELNTDSAVLIDVREKEEVEEGHLDKALWLPLSEFAEAPENYMASIKEAFETKKIYLYCKSGGRSGQVGQFLSQEGLNAINIGGFQELSSEFNSTAGAMDSKKIS